VISKRAGAFDSSGIRKVFDLAATLQDPINLSIGQPDFEMPPAAREAAKAAIDAGRNGYTPTQGIAALRDRLEQEVRSELGSGWPLVIGLALVPVTVIEAGKWAWGSRRRAVS
jgi:aspartate aminotransferase/aminotransferase